MNPLKYNFTSQETPTIEEVGGKGLSLFLSAKEGFNVPESILLTTDFFKSWISDITNSREWQDLISNPNKEPFQYAVKDKCKSLQFTTQQSEILASVLKELDDKLINTMAVRSSSPEEDLDGASFAGIYETILGVNHQNLEASIRLCFASALDCRVINYKIANGFDPSQPKVAVVIQKQINSDVSGVSFSLNPTTNCYDDCIINANWGLGESVVDGTITPDEIIVDKVTRTIIDKKVGKKSIGIYLNNEGGTKTKALNSPNQLCLNDKQILEISDLTTRVEAFYQKPIDIEWAFEKGVLYLLQARPITTYYKLPEEMVTKPGEQKNLYHDATLTEQGLSINTSALGNDIFVLCGLLGMVWMGADEEIFGFDTGFIFGSVGRTHTNIGRLAKLAGKKNAIKMFKLVDDYGTKVLENMDLKPYIPKKLPKGLFLNFVKMSLGGTKFLKGLQKVKKNPEQYIVYYNEQNKKLHSALHELYRQDLLLSEFIYKSMHMTVEMMQDVMIPALMASEGARKNLDKMAKNEPEEIQQHFKNLLHGIPNNVTIEMGIALYELSILDEIKTCSTKEVFLERLERNDFSKDFLNQWRKFMIVYGFRGPLEIDIRTERYYETPGKLFELLKSMSLDENDSKNPKSIYEEGVKRRESSFNELITYYNKKSKVKLNKLKKCYQLVTLFSGYRELPKYNIITAIDMDRRKALRLAEKWVNQGRITEVNQIFDLKYDDLKAAENNPSLDIKSLAEKNHNYFKQFNTNNRPPVLIDSRGFIPKLPKDKQKEGQLIGTPVSTGIAVGTVKVLRTADEKPILPGDILVTSATDPGWTSLFINAGAILLESGGTLQHGASVAREMGKPCIVGVEDVTTLLVDGQQVVVNGDTGEISIPS